MRRQCHDAFSGLIQRYLAAREILHGNRLRRNRDNGEEKQCKPQFHRKAGRRGVIIG